MKENVEEKKRTNKNTIFVTIVLVAILIYTIYISYLLIKKPTDTFTVENGTLYLEESTVGYVIRNETVVQGENYKNGMEQILTEGEKTSKGESIFRYYSSDEENLKEKISELDTKIEEALSKDTTSVYSSDIKLLEEQIDEKVKELSDMTDISKIAEYQKNISDLVIKKAKIAGESSPSGSYIKKLIEERSSYEKQLNSGSQYVESPTSGIVSYRVDGLESTLKTDDFSTLNKDYLEKLDLKTGKIVAESEEYGKVIDNFSCYVVTFLSSDKAKEAKIGDKVSIRFSSGRELDATISYVRQDDDTNVMIVLETDRLVEELTNYRKISFDLIWWRDTGLRVPNQSIVEKDGLTYVIRSRAGYKDGLLVKVKRQNATYSIVGTYSTQELKELGYSTEEISSYKKLTMFDEILVYPSEEYIK